MLVKHAWTIAKRVVPKPIRARVRQLEARLRGPAPADQLERAHSALVMSHSVLSGFDLVLVPGAPHRPDRTLDASFYERQHEDLAYRRNNWLLGELPVLIRLRARTVVELGCGNGRFLRAIAPHAAQVIGLDWARSPELSELPANVDVRVLNAVTDALPAGDLICSADVLEHFAPRDVDLVVSKLVAAGPYQHHVIACYDDGHTHLSILPPAAWLAVFRKHCGAAYLADVHYRRNDPAQIVCVVSNVPHGVR